MIRLFSTAAIAALFMAGIATAETRTFDVGSFTEIDVSGGLDVEFTTGGAQSVTVLNKKDDFSDIVVEVKGDTLILKRKKKNWGGGWKKRPRYLVTVSAPVLSAIEASSGSDVDGTGLTGAVSIDTSSGADVTVRDIQASSVGLESSSGSDISVAGTCTDVRADSSSGSDIEAKALKCETARAEASSGSDITLYASKSLRADVSSGADVNVYGNPTDVRSDKSSGGSVRIKG